MTIPHDTLARFVERILVAAHVPESKAALVADSLVASNLRGVDSHGVQLLPWYVEQISTGDMDPNSDGNIATESGACITYDGGNGLGQVIAQICCGHAVRLAREHGLGMVTARESNHFGAAAYWSQTMAKAGMIGITMCNASPIVAPWQGKDTRFGTNPLCMALPGPNLWLLDMATTTVAMGKIYAASFRKQETIPAGWAMDSEGIPTTETEKALNGLLMPLGGYKGSGLAMMADILCAVLSGGALTTELGGIRLRGKPMRSSQFFLAVDVSRFMPLDEFETRMRAFIDSIKSSRPAAGFDEVMVAGDPEWRTEEIRRRDGIPIGDGVWQNLTEIAKKVGVAAPVGTT
jgi:LDH2 family malate/lactate/ureidoglycolate dehydrogenase